MLTNVGAGAHALARPDDHGDRARRRLDVVRPGGTLVVGPTCTPTRSPSPSASAPSAAAQLVVAPADPGVPVLAARPFQRRNFALARAAAEAFLGDARRRRRARRRGGTRVPGRFEVVADGLR